MSADFWEKENNQKENFGVSWKQLNVYVFGILSMNENTCIFEGGKEEEIQS